VAAVIALMFAFFFAARLAASFQLRSVCLPSPAEQMLAPPARRAFFSAQPAVLGSVIARIDQYPVSGNRMCFASQSKTHAR
jgi:hypothetical protein